jgi:GTP-binding protein LepA
MLDNSVRIVERPSDFPSAHLVAFYEEPIVHVSVMTPTEYVSPLLSLLLDRRGVQVEFIFFARRVYMKIYNGVTDLMICRKT